MAKNRFFAKFRPFLTVFRTLEALISLNSSENLHTSRIKCAAQDDTKYMVSKFLRTGLNVD